MTATGHDYGLADRLLHRLALGMPSVAELSFDLDQKASGAARSAAEVAHRPHVFVAGLARAGTTMILRHIHDTGGFRSLTYRDMPFPLAPNLWKRASARWHRHRQETARAHGDGIGVNADSPEALEEVFWRIHSGADYIRPDGLSLHAPDERAVTLFQRYVAAIIASGDGGQTRYLSKNNNNIIRLPALQHGFPAALFVIPFRDPAAQALSLWRQHRHFSALQAGSPFVRSYMDWLAHHEFGEGHRPCLMDRPAAPGLSPDTPDYWLDMWIRVYLTLAAQATERQVFVCYEELCGDPHVWQDLSQRLALPAAVPSRFRMSGGAERDAFDKAMLDRATALYDALRRLANARR